MGNGPSVDVFQFAAQGYAVGDSRDLGARTLQRLLDVVRRRLALNRGIRGENHFRGAARPDMVRQFRQTEFLGSDTVDRRQASMQNQITAVEATRQFDRDDVGRRLHHAQHRRIAPGARANAAQFALGEGAAGPAPADAVGGFGQGGGQGAGALPVVLQEMQRGAGGCLGADAGQGLQRLDQAVYQGADPHPLLRD